MNENKDSEGTLNCPEYLINQKTLSCLGVVKKDNADIAVIMMQKFTGEPSQQWFFLDGQIQWGADRALCLAPKNEDLQLVPCNTFNENWIFNENGQIVIGSMSLGVRVGRPKQPVKLWPEKGGLQKKWWTLSKLKISLKNDDLSEHQFPPEILDICNIKRNVVSGNESECKVPVAQQKDVCSPKNFDLKDNISESAEFFINQKTLNCLGAAQNENTGIAVIKMQKYTGETTQQWYLVDGQIQWGADRTLCLAPKDNDDVQLVPCSTFDGNWKFNEQSQLIIGSVSLGVRVGKPNKPVKLWPGEGGLKKMWWALSSLRESLRNGNLLDDQIPREILDLCKEDRNLDFKDHSESTIFIAKETEACSSNNTDLKEKLNNAEFLINQKTLNCLGISQGKNAEDLLIEMQQYTGDFTQQWIIADGKIHWGADKTLCLAPKENEDLQLVPCDTFNETWTLNEDGQLIIGSLSLGVRIGQPKKPVKLWPNKGGLQKKWWTLTQLKECFETGKVSEDQFSPEILDICNRGKTFATDERAKCKTTEAEQKELCSNKFINLNEKTSNYAEFFINQKTLNCLGATYNENTGISVIEMQQYTGKPTQQWFVVDGQIQWGADRTLCLAPKDNDDLQLVPCDAFKENWKFNEDDQLIIGSLSLGVRVGKPDKPVKLWPGKGGPKKMWWSLSSLKSNLKNGKILEQQIPSEILKICKEDIDLDSTNQAETMLGEVLNNETSVLNQGTSNDVEFLINQKTLTCLGVTLKKDTGNAAIVMQKYTGDPSQQWILADGKIQWGGDKTLCLAPKNNEDLQLVPCNTFNENWTLNKHGQLIIGSVSLGVRVGRPNKPIKLWPEKGSFQKKWWTLTDLKANLKRGDVSVQQFPPEILKVCEIDSGVVLKNQEQEEMSAENIDLKQTQSNFPEFLINQKTLNYLGATHNEETGIVAIEMQQYTGKPTQQWFIVDGQIQWGADRKLCLAPKDNDNLQLVPCDTFKENWKSNEDNQLIIGSLSLGVRVGKPDKPVKLWPGKGGPKKMWWTLSSLKSNLKNGKLLEQQIPSEMLKICKEECALDSTSKSEDTFTETMLGEVLNNESTVLNQGTSNAGEFFINQKTLTCLGVTLKEDTGNAAIVMQKYTGDPTQQWILADGKIQWGGDKTLCLAPKNNEDLQLVPCDTFNENWTLNKHGQLIIGSVSLGVRVGRPNKPIKLWPEKGSFQKKWWTLTDLKASLKRGDLSGQQFPPEILKVCEIDGGLALKNQEQNEMCAENTNLKQNLSNSPEFLINQNTMNCLGVTQNDNIDNIIVEMQRCTGKSTQQWLFSDGHIIWEADHNLCLAPKDKENLQLVPWDTFNGKWIFREDGQLIIDSKSLGVRVGKPNKPVALWPNKGGLQQKWWTLSDLHSSLENAEVAEHSIPSEIVDICKKERNLVFKKENKLESHHS